MLGGAFAAFAVTYQTGSPFMGIIAGGLAGMLFALLHALLVIERKANQLAVGLTVIFLAQGITAFLGQNYVDKQINGLNPMAIPLLSDIPWIGPVLFNHDVLTYLVFLMVPLVWWFMFRTKPGVLLRATGERDEVVFSLGKSPRLIRYAAVSFGGMMAGLGGAQLSIAFTHTWVENMTQGRGIIAVALVIFAAWLPTRAMLGAYLFGGAQALQLSLQGRGLEVSPFLLFMLPYLLTLLVLFIVERRKVSSMPESLRKVFEGEKGG
jgi:simple sugar transport system permease protein